MRWRTTVPVLALILMLGAVGAWLTRDLWGPAPERAAEHPVVGMPEGPAIAVLPFANLSDDPKQEYFSDGLTEDLMTALSRASSDLRVLARNTTFQYKGRAVDVPKLGRELGEHATYWRAVSGVPKTASGSRRSSSTPRPAPRFGPIASIARWPTSSSSKTRSSARSSPR